ncbi:MAG TPA: GIY-YIG nuclease family protein [Candidatus Paceibacterota bacterium]|jgi:putative endonuclease
MAGVYFVYVIECSDGSLYTGITTDLVRRFKQHREGKGARYTRTHRPVRIVYSEERESRATAQKREAEIKHLTRAQKLVLAGAGPT